MPPAGYPARSGVAVTPDFYNGDVANRARAKGTRYEVELLTILRETFGPGVERAPLKGTADCGDFVGTPVLVEAKSTKVPKFLEWARVATRKAEEHRRSKWWILLWHGDRRTESGQELAVIPVDMLFDLLQCFYGYLNEDPEDDEFVAAAV